MKVLIIGEVYSSNSGDNVICQCVSKLVEECIEDVGIDFLDLSGRSNFSIERSENLEDSISVLKRKAKGFLKDKNFIFNAVKKFIHPSRKLFLSVGRQLSLREYVKILNKNSGHYDLAIFAGGQLCLDYFTISLEYLTRIFKKNNIPIIFNACGYGTVKGRLNKKVIRHAFLSNNVCHISTREESTYIQNEIMGNSEVPIYRTYDPALYADKYFDTFKKELMMNVIGIGVISMNERQAEYNNKIIEIIGALEKEKRAWQLFCNGSQYDFDVIRQIREKISFKIEFEIGTSLCPKTSGELVALITSYKSIISFRLHSHIIATSFLIPSVAIAWDNKVRDFFISFKREKFCCDIEDRAECIVRKLQIAEQEGIDEVCLMEQKEFLKKNLHLAIIKSQEIIGEENNKHYIDLKYEQ